MKKLIPVLIIVVALFILFRSVKKDDGNSILNLSSSGNNDQISTIIVPHHDLVADLRGQFLAELSQELKLDTIILVSTNHADHGSADIITTKKNWQLSEGIIAPDHEKIDQLLGDALLVAEDSPFDGEHGITNILEPVKQNFRDAKIIPIIIKSKTESTKINSVTSGLKKVCGQSCVMIASIDFSHYQPGALAEIHDATTIRLLSNLDEENINLAETDSDEILLLALKWAKESGTEKFNLWKNTNSGKITGERDSESTSYVMASFEKGEKKENNSEFSFIIGGDMMFDRNIEYHFQGDKLVDVMSEMGNRVFWGTDLSLANLEGPISKERLPYDNTKGNMIFNFQPETASVLKWLGINAVSLANNHTLNNGQKGLATTKEILTEVGIAYIGQDAKFNDESIRQFTYGGVKVSVLAIDTLNTNTDLVPIIKAEREKSDFIIVMPHWGVEYEPIHHSSQESLAHKWINAGADLIAGSHPHVIQDAEIYQGRPIFYSLGNLLFDQDFSAETQRGLIIAGIYNIETKKLTMTILPTISKKYKPALMIGTEKTTTLSKYRKNFGIESGEKGYGYDKIELQY